MRFFKLPVVPLSLILISPNLVMRSKTLKLIDFHKSRSNVQVLDILKVPAEFLIPKLNNSAKTLLYSYVIAN